MDDRNDINNRVEENGRNIKYSLKKSYSNAKKTMGQFNKLRGANRSINRKRKMAKFIAKGVKFAAKATSAIIKLIIKLLLSFWWLILIILAIAFIWFIFFDVSFNQPATSGTYTENVENIDIKDDGKSGTLENSVMLLFYTKYSNQSYYYTIDNKNTIYQASSNMKVKDFEGRDSMFALNPGALYILDKYLNEGHINPSQFIRPIYNTCSTGEEKSGMCEMKELTNEDGKLIAESVKYKEQNDHSYLKIDNETEKGIWNWGLAPILHYKKFDQESQVQNYHVDSFEIFDRESGDVRTISYDDYEAMNDKQKKEIQNDFKKVLNGTKNIPSTVEEGDREDNGTIPPDDIAYAIDNIASMFGTITNEINLTWVYQKDYVNVSEPISWSKWYDDATEKEMKNKRLIKKIKKGSSTWEAIKLVYGKGEITLSPNEEKEAIKAAEEAKEKAKKEGKNEVEQERIYQEVYKKAHEANGYTITMKDGSNIFIAGNKDDFKVSVQYKADLHITKSGQLMKHTVSYENDQPNLSKTSGLGYLKDYIENYQTYVETEEEDKFYCKVVANTELNEAAKQAYANDTEKLEDLWSKITMKKLADTASSSIRETTNDTVNQIYDKSGSQKLTTTDKSQIVKKPSECAKNTVAVKINPKTMKSFYVNDLPNIQTLGIAKELGYDVALENGSISMSSSLGLNTIVDTGINSDKENSSVGENDKGELIRTKYKDIVKEASKDYGVDANLIFAIIEATSGGDDKYNSTSFTPSKGCTSPNGCGIMGIHTNEFEGMKNLTAFNFTKKKTENFATAEKILDKKGFMEAENNIIYGTMLLQRYMKQYNYNHLLAIQAYSYGTANTESLLKYYEKMTGADRKYTIDDTVMYEWTAYREYCENNPKKCYKKNKAPGDKKFVEKVLSAFGTVDTISIRTENKSREYETLDFKFLKGTEGKSASQALNDRIMNMYLRKGGDKYWKKYWDVLYAGQMDFNNGSFKISKRYLSDSMPKKAKKVEYKYRNSITDVNGVIQTMFGFTENLPATAFNDLSDEYWRTRYASMFKTAGSKAWSSNYELGNTFNGSVELPVNNPVIIDDFGWKVREGKTYSYSPTTEILATQGQQVEALASGKVIGINTKGQGETFITILHNDGDGDVEDNNDNKEDIKEDNKEDDKENDKENDTQDKEEVTNAELMTGTWDDIRKMGLTEERVKDIIKAKYTDLKSDSVLRGKASYFVEYCKKKDVNPFLIAAISAQESGYGTSDLAKRAYNFGGMEANHKDAVGAWGRWAIFANVEAGIRAHIDLLSDFYIHIGLNSPSKMAPKYCEGSSSWVVAVNSIYSTISGQIFEASTQAVHTTVKKYVSYSYYGLENIQVKEGDIVEAGDVIGYVSDKNTFKMAFVDDNIMTDIAEVFKTLEDSRARMQNMLSVGGVTGSNDIGVDINTPSFGKLNPYSYPGQCVWYVWGRANQVTGASLPNWGNARDWCDNARASGYKTGMTPSLGAVIVWDNGGYDYGHVAYIEEYNNDGTLVFTDGNYGNPCDDGTCDQVAYAAAHPGELLHRSEKVTVDDLRNYRGNIKCFVYLDSKK